MGARYLPGDLLPFDGYWFIPPSGPQIGYYIDTHGLAANFASGVITPWA
jgi:hypothetical protein